jgi:hypothetical protein
VKASSGGAAGQALNEEIFESFAHPAACSRLAARLQPGPTELGACRDAAGPAAAARLAAPSPIPCYQSEGLPSHRGAGHKHFELRGFQIDDARKLSKVISRPRHKSTAAP